MSKPLEENGQRAILVPSTTVITTAVTGIIGPLVVTNVPGTKYLVATGKVVYGSGGTTIKVWIQTSLDGGLTWIDIMSLAFTTATLTKVGAVAAFVTSAAPATPTDGSLADNTKNEGLLGDRFRAKYTTTGTYGGNTTLEVDIMIKE